MSNITDNPKIQVLKAGCSGIFTNYIYKAIPLAFDESMSYYETLAGLLAYLKDVILPTVNGNAEAVAELQELYIQLNDYVTNYFDNLDVQEEINNKLDKMVEDGIFENILHNYAQVTKVFDTYNNMIFDTSTFVNGMKLKTLGYHYINDGGGAEYFVTNVQNDNKYQISIGTNLWIELIENGKGINVLTVGLYNDGVTDNTSLLRNLIKKLYNSEVQSGFRNIKKIYFPKGTYIIDGTIIDSQLNVGGLTFYFEGEGKFNTILRCNANIVFDNNQIFGNSIFENIQFIGNNDNLFLNFVGGGSGNAQNLQFNKCYFRSFHKIIDVTGDTMCSEVTFLETSIKACGTDNNPCELFKFDNSQAVNWRFYSTDIESFRGVLFHLLKGTSIYWYQGSCIPSGDSKVFSFEKANPNYFAGGNFPTFSIDGVRFEIRDNSILYYKGITNNTSNAKIRMFFSNCGMGGQNIPTSSTTKQIQLFGGNNNIKFENCYNLDKYKISSNTATGGYTTRSDLIEFINTDVNIENVLENSEFNYTGSTTSYLPEIIVNGLNYRVIPDKLQIIKDMSFKNQILINNADDSGFTIRNSDSDVTKEVYINNYVKDINVLGISRTAYGNSATFTASFYDDNNVLIGSVTNPIQSDSDDTIPCKKYIKKLKIVTTSNYSGAIAVRKPLIISVNRL